MPRLVCLLCFMIVLAGCREDIAHDLSEVRANQVLILLRRNGLEPEKSRNGTQWSVSVPHSDTLRALVLVNQSRVLDHDLDRFRESAKGFVQSREERQQAGERALAWGLETTLERIPGVLEARVHLRTDGTTASAKGSVNSAGVLLLVEGDGETASTTARSLVSGGAGIPAESVSVAISKMSFDMQSNPVGANPGRVEGVAAFDSAAALPIVAVVLAIALFGARASRIRNERVRSTLRPVLRTTNGIDRTLSEVQ